MLALFAEPSGATFYLDIQEPLPVYRVPRPDGKLSYMPGSLAKLGPLHTMTVHNYKLVGLSKPLGEQPIAFYDREMQW